METTSTSVNRWLIRWRESDAARLRLFCFPYAGSSAWSFISWQEELPTDVELCAVELPGRATRLSETPHLRISTLNEAMSEALLPYLDKPFAFFGHSMGALIGFEFTRHLRRNYQLIPRHLFVSGRRAPQIPYREPRTFDLPDEEFLQDLFSSSGSQRDRFDPQITKLLLPMMRADFEVVQTHVYSPEPPLSCPITVFGGSYDNVVTREQLDAWQHQTMSRCTVRILPGDHFFIKTSQAELLQSISQELQ